MKNLLTLMLFISTCMAIHGQNCNGTLTGQVIDYHNKTELAKATVSLIGTTKKVFSKADGSYIIKGICAGEYELEVSHDACNTQIISVFIDGETQLDITLEHHLEELQEVNVVGDAVFSKTNSAQEVSLKSSTIEQYSTATLGHALKELGGIATLNTGANIVKPAIHGLNGSRVLIINDGVRMQDMEWGDEHAPNVDLNTAASIAVIKGASALQYGGDAIGGTIILEPQRFPAKDTILGKVMLSGVSNGRGGNLVAEHTKVYKNGFFIKGQGSYKRLGDQEAPNYILSNTAVQEYAASAHLGKRKFEWGYSGKYAYFNTEIAILRSSHIGNVDNLITAINSGQPAVVADFTYSLDNPRQKVRHHLVKLEGYKRFEGLGKWTAQYDYQNNRRFEFDLRRGGRSDQASIDLKLTTHTLSTDFKWDAKDNFKLHLGLMGRYQENFANPDTGVRRLIPDYEKIDFGQFVTATYYLDDNWTADAGFRYDFSRMDAQKFYRTSRWEERGYNEDFADLIVEDRGTQLLTNPLFNYHNFSTAIGINYSSNPDNNLKFNYTMAQRAPNPAELFSDGLHHSAARIELGDLRLGSETAHQLMLTYQKDFTHWGVTLEPYANLVNNFILLEPTGVELSLRGAFPVWSYRQTDARILGVDLSAYAQWHKKWRSEHIFALAKGKEVDQDRALINIPATNLINKLSFTHKPWHDLQLNLQSNYTFRQNEYPPNITVFSPAQQQEVLLAINTPPKAYHNLNFNGSMGFKWGQKRITTALTVNNILNNTYRDYLNRQRFFADDLGTNIILQLKLNY